MAEVSVFLTSYNHEKYLIESINSVINQTYKDFELIIADDASTDNSWDIIKKFTDTRIKAFRNSKNDGGYFLDLFPQGLKGKYIAIHHSDDIWEPDKLERQVAYLDQNPGIGAVFTNASIIGEDGLPFTDVSHFYYNIFSQPNRTRHQWLNHFFFRGNALCHPSLLIRKECYERCGSYRNGFVQLGDFDMWVRLCFKYEIYVLPQKLVQFRVRDNFANASSATYENTVRQQFEYLQILDNYLQISSFEELVEIFPEAEKFYRSEGTDLPFSLAMIALQNSQDRPYHEIFGLQLLFNAIQDPVRAKKINSLYGFDVHDYFELSGKHDIFSIYSRIKLPEVQEQLENEKRICQDKIESLKADVESLNAELVKTVNTRIWRYTRVFRQLNRLLRKQ